MKRTFFINLLLMTVALSCSVNDFESEAVVNATESQEFRSIESALSSLEDFIRKNYPSTKSFVIRSIGRYYGDCPRTKGDDESIPEPLAYVVNFGDGDGFAVLGTRKEHPDIVAITESGSIDTLTLAITFVTITQRHLSRILMIYPVTLLAFIVQKTMISIAQIPLVVRLLQLY